MCIYRVTNHCYQSAKGRIWTRFRVVSVDRQRTSVPRLTCTLQHPTRALQDSGREGMCAQGHERGKAGAKRPRKRRREERARGRGMRTGREMAGRRASVGKAMWTRSCQLGGFECARLGLYAREGREQARQRTSVVMGRMAGCRQRARSEEPSSSAHG